MKKLDRFRPMVNITLFEEDIEPMKDEVKDLRNKIKRNPDIYSPDQLRIFRNRKNFLIKLLKKRGVKV